MKKLGFLVFVFSLVISLQSYSQKKAFGWEDAMKFKRVSQASITDNGDWVVYYISQDRGDGAAYLKSLVNNVEYQVPRGGSYKCSENTHWFVFTVKPKAIETENADKDKPKNGMSIINTMTGKIENFEKVENFKISSDGSWLAYKVFTKKEDSEKLKQKEIGTELTLRHLPSGTEIKIPYVTEYIIDTLSQYVFYVKSDIKGENDGLYYRNLNIPYVPELVVSADTTFHYSNLTWNNKKQTLAFVNGDLNDKGSPKFTQLSMWTLGDAKPRIAINKDAVKDWYIPKTNQLKWTKDGERLFFGFKPISEKYRDEADEFKLTDSSFFNVDSIRKKTDLYIWHWDDPLILSNERTNWSKSKDKTYKAVYHLNTNKFVKLADTNLYHVDYVENPNYTIGYDNSKYQKEIAYYGSYDDLYAIDLNTGERNKVAEKLEEPASISPTGRFVTFFKNKAWNSFYIKEKSYTNLTENISYPFYDVDWDMPANPPSYGMGGWHEFDDFVILYDQYDVWKISPIDGAASNITVGEGRALKNTYRAIQLDPDVNYYTSQDTMLLSFYSNSNKWRGLAIAEFKILGTTAAAFDSTKWVSFYGKAKNANKILISYENYETYPDLIYANLSFVPYDTLTNLNSQISGYKWGTTELVSWTTSRGDTLQGFIIKPADYVKGKKYPVITYFYEQFSQNFRRFSHPQINHRPNYQIYNSDGYVVFLPDIKFYTGSPGESALDALTTGNKKLIDMGIADPNALGIQGHSWGGYETAYIVTKTNMFKAAVSGAPVGNMTSAYSGIRLESGLPRQFQYEASQSRIGGNLWDSLDAYIRNSPVFNARTMNTPLLIMFGDNDEAVPMSQGVELYMALRRLEKPVIMLNYDNEMHHPRKYENKLDYAIKMKQFFDHYLKGKPAAAWITTPIPYKGEYLLTD